MFTAHSCSLVIQTANVLVYESRESVFVDNEINIAASEIDFVRNEIDIVYNDTNSVGGESDSITSENEIDSNEIKSVCIEICNSVPESDVAGIVMNIDELESDLSGGAIAINFSGILKLEKYQLQIAKSGGNRIKE